jgi:hypothetical protein
MEWVRSPSRLTAEAYLHYIRRQNPTIEGPNLESTRTTVINAYEYALKECGVDRESGEIWQEYITYLGEGEVRTLMIGLMPAQELLGRSKAD